MLHILYYHGRKIDCHSLFPQQHVYPQEKHLFFDFETFSPLSVPKLLEFDMLLEVHFIETPEAQAPCVIKYSAPERFTVLF